jgi:flagellar export protein FliJ
MKSRDSVVRLKRFQVDEKKRQVEQIDAMIAEFDRMSNELDLQIDAEKERTGISDPSHFAYSTYARAAEQRRENLRASVAELRVQRQVASAELSAAREELEKIELIAERDQTGQRAEGSDRAAG